MVILTNSQEAILIAHAINTLEDGVCCYHECAPCKVLNELLTTNRLSDAVRPYVEQAGSGWDWWDEHANTVREEWFKERFCTPSPHID